MASQGATTDEMFEAAADNRSDEHEQEKAQRQRQEAAFAPDHEEPSRAGWRRPQYGQSLTSMPIS